MTKIRSIDPFYTVVKVFDDGQAYSVLSGSYAGTPFTTRELSRAKAECTKIIRRSRERRSFTLQIIKNDYTTMQCEVVYSC